MIAFLFAAALSSAPTATDVRTLDGLRARAVVAAKDIFDAAQGAVSLSKAQGRQTTGSICLPALAEWAERTTEYLNEAWALATINYVVREPTDLYSVTVIVHAQTQALATSLAEARDRINGITGQCSESAIVATKAQAVILVLNDVPAALKPLLGDSPGQ